MIKHFLVMCFSMLAFMAFDDAPVSLAQGSSEEKSDESEAAREMAGDEELAAEETSGHLIGEVLAVDKAAKTILVKEDDFTQDMDLIFISRDTNFVTVSSLSDIKKGDTISVDYVYFNDKMTADSIVLEERAEEEEGAPEPVEKVLKD